MVGSLSEDLHYILHPEETVDMMPCFKTDEALCRQATAGNDLKSDVKWQFAESDKHASCDRPLLAIRRPIKRLNLQGYLNSRQISLGLGQNRMGWYAGVMFGNGNSWIDVYTTKACQDY